MALRSPLFQLAHPKRCIDGIRDYYFSNGYPWFNCLFPGRILRDFIIYIIYIMRHYEIIYEGSIIVNGLSKSTLRLYIWISIYDKCIFIHTVTYIFQIRIILFNLYDTQLGSSCPPPPHPPPPKKKKKKKKKNVAIHFRLAVLVSCRQVSMDYSSKGAAYNRTDVAISEHWPYTMTGVN